MAVEITIPRLGWSMDEGTFGEWLKADGELVEPGEAIFTLESEKALQEVESVDGGILRVLSGGPEEGDTVNVGTLVGYLLDDGEELPTQPVLDSAVESSAVTAAAASIATVPVDVTKNNTTSATENTSAAQTTSQPSAEIQRRNSNGTPAISPRAAKVAVELGVDWSTLSGSGRTGRIRERDVRAAATQPSAESSPRPGPSVNPHLGTTRRVIARRMMDSVQSTAPVTLTMRVNATNLVSLRQQYKASGNPIVPAYHDIIARLAALTLTEHPVMNCQWTDDGLVQPDGIHIGLAVDTEAGLLVPVLRDVDKVSLLELAKRSTEVVARAQRRRCSSEELNGGTFTITNLGQFGIDTFTPIINAPQTAILGLGSIRREAVVLDDDRIVPQDQLSLSLTFDHRVTDGAPAARFLQQLSARIENPGPWLIQ